MTALHKLERDFVHADLAAVQSLLSQLRDDDVMTRFGLEARRNELLSTIAALDAMPDEQIASAALFFGGGPVIGGRGIESGFAGSAVSKFQDIVAKVLAHETSGLGQRGMVPKKSASTLHITNIVRGSFGFLFEELQPQQTMIETSLKMAVDETVSLLDAFGESDEEKFSLAIEEIDHRVLATAREFFELMRQNGATLRLVAGENDHSFGLDAVNRAAERAASTTVEDLEETKRGWLAGVLPDAHQFEFKVSGQEIIRGKVSRALTSDQLTMFNRDWVNINASAQVHVKRVRRDGVIIRESFTLLSLSPLA